MTMERLVEALRTYLNKEMENAQGGFMGMQSEYDMGKEVAYENVLDFLDELLEKEN